MATSSVCMCILYICIHGIRIIVYIYKATLSAEKGFRFNFAI